MISGSQRTQTHNRQAGVQVLALPLASCVTLSKFFNLSEPQSSQDQSGN